MVLQKKSVGTVTGNHAIVFPSKSSVFIICHNVSLWDMPHSLAVSDFVPMTYSQLFGVHSRFTPRKPRSPLESEVLLE